MPCPHCGVTAVAEQAKRTALGSRIFRCRSSRRRFTERTGTPVNQLQVPTDIALLVVLWRLRFTLSLRDLAEMFLIRGFAFAHESDGRPSSRSGPPLDHQVGSFHAVRDTRRQHLASQF